VRELNPNPNGEPVQSLQEADDAEDIFPRLYQPPTDEESLAAVALAECPAIPFPAVCPPDTNERGTINGETDPVAYLVLLNTTAEDLALGLFYDRKAAVSLAKAAYQDPASHVLKCPQKCSSTCFISVQVVEFVGSEPKFVTTLFDRHAVTDSLFTDWA
jgi:hypothetical protein